MLQFSETIDPAGQHVKAKVMLQNVHKQTDSLTRLCARANGMSKTRYPNESVKDVFGFPSVKCMLRPQSLLRECD